MTSTADPTRAFRARVLPMETRGNDSRSLCTLPEIDVTLVYAATKGLTRVPPEGVKAVIPVHWNIEGGLVGVHEDGTVAAHPFGPPRPESDEVLAGLRNFFSRPDDFVAVPTTEPTGESVERGFLDMGWEVPPIVRALNARQAALSGDHTYVDSFTSEVLGRWSGWRESVSTALLGDWAGTLFRDGRLSPDVLTLLEKDASTVHRQYTPVWDRKIGRKRLLLLDTPLAEGTTLHDLLANRPGPEFPSSVDDLDDPRLQGILRQLTPQYRAVVLALGNPGVSTWAEAAALAGASAPGIYGEKVRRKVKRLAAEIGSRA
ncbi:hypothetical protein [Streptomyces sp. NPDC014744]|uniref:hypothetical protein n=1 Tax=Streptomyces sp. NPDC014744 TaxID=3364903 RepID=UPI0036FE11B0